MKKSRFVFSHVMLWFKLWSRNSRSGYHNLRNSWFKAGLTAGVPMGDAKDISSFNVGVDGEDNICSIRILNWYCRVQSFFWKR